MLALAKYLREEKLTPRQKVYAHFTVYEEIGHGGCGNIPAGVTQLLWGIGVPDVKTTYYDDIRLTYLSDTAATGIGDIHTVTAPSSQNDAWYTLQGVRVARPTAPGVYIRGGRKYVIR